MAHPVLPHGAVVVRDADEEAQSVVREGVAVGAGHAIVRAVAQLVVGRQGGTGQHPLAAHVEGPPGADVHGAAQAAFHQIRLRRLVHLHRLHEFRLHRIEVERARVLRHAERAGRANAGGHRRAPVHLHPHELRPQAANGHERPFAALPVDGDAGDALQRFGQVLVRELADVLRHQGIDDVVRGALHLDGLPHAAANAAHDDLLKRAGRLLRRGGFAGRRQRECRQAQDAAHSSNPLRPCPESHVQIVHWIPPVYANRLCMRIAATSRSVETGPVKPRSPETH